MTARDHRCGTLRGVLRLCIAQNKAADELLSRDPLALVVGTLLDQHMSRGTERICKGR